MSTRSGSLPCRTRLDRFLAIHSQYSRREARLLLAQRRVMVNQQMAVSVSQVIDPFDTVSLDSRILQQREAVYLAMHKPAGVISATSDPEQQTVLDVLRSDQAVALTSELLDTLHIVGRLDKHSTGLLLLTNDSAWSERLMSPVNKVAKVYEVRLEKPLDESYIEAFASGMYFPYENITTQPVQLKILSDRVARVTLMEGRYHQIKRMFGRFRNPVLQLHRTAIGPFQLPESLKPGASQRVQADLAIKDKSLTRE